MTAKGKARAAQRKEEMQFILAMRDTMPQEVKEFFERIVMEACDVAEKHNLHPRQMAVGAAALVGVFAMAEVGGNVHADKAIDDYLSFADHAMSIAVANCRIAAGWRPAGPN